MLEAPVVKREVAGISYTAVEPLKVGTQRTWGLKCSKGSNLGVEN